MTNRTQCPNCLTNYYISDQQYRRCRGKVRCGNCKQTFNAVLVSAEDAKSKSERLSKRILHAQRQARAEALEKHKQKREHRKQQEMFFESVSEEEHQHSVSQIDVDPSTVTLVGLDDTETEVTHERKPEKQAPVEVIEEPSSVVEQDYTEPKASLESDSKPIVEPQLQTLKTDQSKSTQSDQELISKVDQLIQEKLTPNQNVLSQKPEDITPSHPLPEKFKLNRMQKTAVKKQFQITLLVAAALVLSIVLFYQLWLRQGIPFLEPNTLPRPISKISDSIASLAKNYNIELPIRSDLSNMHLVSAHTQAHPTRASTTLLIVGLLNKSTITQPYPWLELSLSDEDGRLISRRALSPYDYRHNNRLRHLIQPKELRQVTIELLAFPKQAHGFELKILDKQ